MSKAIDAGKLSDESKHLFNKTVQGNINLFKRLSALATEGVKEFYGGPQRKLPSLGEGITRLAELNLSCWSAAVEHSLAFANGVTSAYERALDLTPSASETRVAQPARKSKPRKSKRRDGKGTT
jgi:hypothetical protein